MTRFLLMSDSFGFVDAGRFLWRENEFAVYNCCWSLPAQWSLGPGPAGLVIIFSRVKIRNHFLTPNVVCYLVTRQITCGFWIWPLNLLDFLFTELLIIKHTQITLTTQNKCFQVYLHASSHFFHFCRFWISFVWRFLSSASSVSSPSSARSARSFSCPLGLL
jgi:hypothetical protein